jgi:nitroreductase
MNKNDTKTFVLDAYNFRHACKLFDKSKTIPKEDFEFILETGRLSPTSFGMQGVKLLVVEEVKLKKEMKAACWNQNQLDSCSHVVVYVTKTKALEPGTAWVKSRFADREMPLEKQEAYYEAYAGFHTNLKERVEGYFKRVMVGFFYKLFHKKREPKDIYQWGARQAYILLGNMMSSAAMIGIDSCPIEGFDKNALEKVLDIDTENEEVAVVCTFGYRVNEANEKRRLPLSEITEFRVS